MIDFILSILSSILQIDMRDHHNMPFALPLLLIIFGGGFMGYTVVRLIPEKEEK